MGNLFRCAVCRSPLPASNTIDEQWVEDEQAPQHWRYLMHCAGCACVSLQEVDARNPARPSVRASVEFAPALVIRWRERLEVAERESRLRAELAAARRDRQGRMLLRVPAVFEIARRLLTPRVRTCLPAWFAVSSANLPGQRPTLQTGARHPLAGRTGRFAAAAGAPELPARSVADGAAFVVEPGFEFRVRDVDETRLLLAVDHPSWSFLDALLAWPDQVEPV